MKVVCPGGRAWDKQGVQVPLLLSLQLLPPLISPSPWLRGWLLSCRRWAADKAYGGGDSGTAVLGAFGGGWEVSASCSSHELGACFIALSLRMVGSHVSGEVGLRLALCVGGTLQVRLVRIAVAII